jgi:CRISPR/Cas system endoribonuclease Cas6 (RAMP superfamily)
LFKKQARQDDFVVFQAMPFTLHLGLNLTTQPEAPALGLGLHGMIYRQLGQLDPDLAGVLHQERGRPHVPAAFSMRLRSRADDGIACEINLLDEALLEPFVQAFTVGLQFGGGDERLQGEIDDVYLSGLRYEDMIRYALSAPAPNRVELHFQTCTAIRHDNRPLRSPVGLHLWNGMRARWLTHSPFPEFAFESEYELEFLEPPELDTDSIRVPQRTAHGFVGRASYEIIGHPEARRIAGTLARFAEFSGVGQHVAFGGGNVLARIG